MTIQNAFIKLFILLSLFFASNISAQEGCELPNLDSILNAQTFGPSDSLLTDCAACDTCTNNTLPEDLNWADMLADADSLNSNDTLLGAYTVGELEDEYDNQDSTSVYSGYPMSEDHLVAFTNTISSNINMAELVDCYDFNCELAVVLGLPLDSLLTDLTVVDSILAAMDPDVLQDNMVAAGNDSTINYSQYFQDSLFSEIDGISTTLNNLLNSININQLAEQFYGVSPVTTIPCDSIPPSLSPPSSGDPKDADVDFFSDAVHGLGTGNEQLLPSPAAMAMIDQVSTGVDLYNGLPDVGVSLYSLQSNDISIPISLSYNGSGVKVNEYGSEMGTSWNLNAGGQISRVVSGLPDEFEGTTYGSGVGPIPKLNACAGLTGAGVTLFAPPPKVRWSPCNPGVLKLYVVVYSGAIVIPPFITIPYFVTIELTARIDVSYLAGRINYEEKGLGYLHIDNLSKMNEFSLGDVDLDNFDNLSPAEKTTFFHKALGRKSIEDLKFLYPEIAMLVEYWQGIETFFTGEQTKKLTKLDTEPDEFFFNFGGYSGKFVLDQNGSIHTIPPQDLVIEKTEGSLENPNNSHIVAFTATTPQGLKYHFGSTSGEGVERSNQISYTLSNQLTYPVEGGGVPPGNTRYGLAKLDEAALPSVGFLMCPPKVALRGNTYERNYSVMNSPWYTSTWHLTKIESIFTGESMTLEYDNSGVLRYYSQKTITHNYPNFDAGTSANDGELVTNSSSVANPSHLVLKTEWPHGKANLTYTAIENKLIKYRVKAIKGLRGDSLKFIYSSPRLDIVGDSLLTDIHLITNGLLSKGWKFNYDLYNPPTQCTCDNQVIDGPVFASDKEFSFSLDALNEKLRTPFRYYVNAFFPTLPVVYLNIPIAIQADFSSKGHYKKMSEFGSLVEIKHYEGILDTTREINMFRGESARSFLYDIKEISREGGNRTLFEFDYHGNLLKLPKRFSFNQDLWGYFNYNLASLSPLPSIEYKSVAGNQQSIETHQDLKNHIPFVSQGAQTNTYLGHNEAADFDRAVIGVLDSITFITGGVKSFTYELNDWPTAEGDTIKGAGLRVKRLKEDPGDSPAKVIKYSYKKPTIVNRPIRISDHPFNGYIDPDSLIETEVKSSSAPLNPWLMNKNNYVGYAHVIQDIQGGGSIEHHFTSPSDYPPELPTIYRITQNMNSLFGTPPTYTFIDSAITLEPFPQPLAYHWRYGLEKDIIVKNEAGDTVKSVHNTYVFDEFTRNRVAGVKVDLLQINHSGSFLENVALGAVMQYFAPSCSVVEPIAQAILSGDPLSNPFSKIIKHYFYSIYDYKFEQPRLISKEETLCFPDGSTSSFVTNNTYKSGFLSDYSRVVSDSTVFNNGQILFNKYLYASDSDLTTSLAKMNSSDLSYLKVLGNSGFGTPIRTERYENGHLTGGSIRALKQDGAQVVPTSIWKVQNGKFVLAAEYKDWHSSTLPTEIAIAEYGTGADVSDYTFFEHPIKFSWNSQLLLSNKSRGIFQESYSYNEYKDLIDHTDINGVVSEFEYDEYARLETSTLLNDRQTNTFTYSFQPNHVQTTTSYSDGTPSQQFTKNFNGLGFHVSTIRSDGAIMESFGYDNLFRVAASSKLQTGFKVFSYEASPISRLLSETDAVGNTFSYAYSGYNPSDSVSYSYSKIITTDPNGHASSLFTDAFEKTLLTRSGEGSLTGYSYDTLARLVEIVNPIGETYGYVYNDMDQVISKKVPGANEYSFWLDERFHLAVSKDANGNTLLYEYDDYDRISNVYHYDSTLNLPVSGIVEISNVESLFDSLKLVTANVYDDANNKNWLLFKKERIFSDFGNGDFKLTDNTAIDDIGRVTEVMLTYPQDSVKITSSYNDAGLLRRTENHYIQENIIMNLGYTYDDLLRPHRTTLTRQSGNGGILFKEGLSELEYNDRDLVKAKFLGRKLQKVDYLYDAIGRLIQINSFPTLECFEDQPFCGFEATLEYDLSSEIPPSCQLLSAIQIDTHFYSVNPVVDLVPNDPTPSDSILANQINLALDSLGYWGYASEQVSYDGSIYSYYVSITNTNADSIILHFQDCQNTLVFDSIKCCNTDEPPADSTETNGLIGGSDDLFYQKITYTGLDITRIELASNCASGIFRNDYTYDANHRLKKQANTIFKPEPVYGNYSTAYTYDLAGNILNLQRNGLVPPSGGGSSSYNSIDSLFYTYSNERLYSVRDSIADTLAQKQGFEPELSQYGYDNNGNMVSDNGKNITIDYNLLNLPQKISTSSGNVFVDYTFGGEKIRKITPADTIKYLVGMEYVDASPEIFYHSEGRIIMGQNNAQYKIVDHLGNTVVLFEDSDNDGTITSEDETANPSEVEVFQRNLYYPFGLSLKGTWVDSTSPHMNYLYNGKEWNNEGGLGWLDYGFRWYDPAVGRFPSVDPMAHKMPEWSPYSYTFNNPLKYTDPDGRIPTPIIGFAIGFGLDVATQMIFEGKSLSEVDYGSAAVSGVAGMASGGLSSIKNFGKAGQIVLGATVDAGESVGKQVISGDNISGEQILSDVVMGGIGGQAKVFDDANIKVKENTLDRTQRIAKNDPASSGRAQNVNDAQKSVDFANRMNDAAGTAAGNTLQTGSDNAKSFLNTGDGTGSFIQPQIQMAQDNTRVVIPIIDPKSK